jgi:hypothetical protein
VPKKNRSPDIEMKIPAVIKRARVEIFGTVILAGVVLFWDFSRGCLLANLKQFRTSSRGSETEASSTAVPEYCDLGNIRQTPKFCEPI